MTDRVVVQDIAEVSSRPTPESELPEFQGEVLSRASFGASAATFTPETAIAPVPPNLAATWLAESLAHPWPPIDTPVFLVEVLRRDTAAAAIVAYVDKTQVGSRPPLDPPARESLGGALAIDAASRANLELSRTLSGERRGSLLRAFASKAAAPLRVAICTRNAPPCPFRVTPSTPPASP